MKAPEARHRWLPLRLDIADLLLGSVQRVSSQAKQRRSALSLGMEGFLTSWDRHRGLPFWLGSESLLSGSAQRVSARAQHRRPPLGFGIEGLPVSSLPRASSPRKPHLLFGAEGLLSVSAQRASSLTRHRGPPLCFGTRVVLDS